jgi:hypothetical protein
MIRLFSFRLSDEEYIDFVANFLKPTPIEWASCCCCCFAYNIPPLSLPSTGVCGHLFLSDECWHMRQLPGGLCGLKVSQFHPSLSLPNLPLSLIFLGTGIWSVTFASFFFIPNFLVLIWQKFRNQRKTNHDYII